MLGLLSSDIDFANDDIRVMLVSSAYVFDKAHEFVSDITGEVTNASGSGYERKQLLNESMSLEGDEVVFDADNPTYSLINTNETISAAVIFKQVSNDADSPVLFYCQFVNSQGNAAGLETIGVDVQPQISVNGIARVKNILE